VPLHRSRALTGTARIYGKPLFSKGFLLEPQPAQGLARYLLNSWQVGPMKAWPRSHRDVPGQRRPFPATRL